jgi:hypothetical protein
MAERKTAKKGTKRSAKRTTASGNASKGKFKDRYATFGFNDKANLDEGHMWPTAFALKELTAPDEKRIGALVQKAVS